MVDYCSKVRAALLLPLFVSSHRCQENLYMRMFLLQCDSKYVAYRLSIAIVPNRQRLIPTVGSWYDIKSFPGVNERCNNSMKDVIY